MGKLNAPREVPYDFRVVEVEGVAWLYDDSTRTYICSSTPTIYLEPLYAVVPAEESVCPKCLEGTVQYVDEDAECPNCKARWQEDISHLEGDYFGASWIEKLTNYPVPLDDEDIAPTTSRHDAWDYAREEAQGNHLV